MDPSHRECYAEAQARLRELFHELSRRGGVGPSELQRELLPFTAGDARRDLLALVDDLQRRRVVLDESEFVRAMWKKMYLPHMLFAAKLGAGASGRGRGAEGAVTPASVVNVPFTHVLVSLKRRAQMQQFADYYRGRGVTGADHLTAGSSAHATSEASARSPVERRQRLSQSQRLASTDTTASPPAPVMTVMDLRQRRTPTYDVVACVFDGQERALKTHVLRERVRLPHLRTLSSLYCVLFSPEDGVFALGSSHFAEKAQDEFHDALDRYNASESGGRYPARPVKVAVPRHQDLPSMVTVKLEDVGLRNVAAISAAKGQVAVSTGRKLHLWKSQEPLRAFTAQNNVIDFSSASEDTFDPMLSTDSVEEFDMNAADDCLGLLGGSKLLGRAKTIVDLASVTHLAVNDGFVFALTSTGDLYSWPRSSSLSAATTTELAAVSPSEQAKSSVARIPLELSSPSERVRRVACGRRHVLALSSSGAVFVWGSNECGQLGLGSDSPLLDRHIDGPTKLELCVPDEGADEVKGSPTVCEAIDVACGSDHSLVLSADGQMLVFGCHWYGQLGLGEDNAVLVDGCCFHPTRLMGPSRANGDDPATLASGHDRFYLVMAQGDSSAAVNTRGEVFQWGKCVPSGTASVCGLVSRWQPELVVELSDESGADSSTSGGQGGFHSALPTWYSIAIAHGVLVLAKHASTSG